VEGLCLLGRLAQLRRNCVLYGGLAADPHHYVRLPLLSENGAHELYDLAKDPYELTNVLHGGASAEQEAIQARYTDLSQRMSACSGRSAGP
jgi:hypothetical protein